MDSIQKLLVSPWHVGTLLKHTGIAVHIATIATAKHIHNYAWYLLAIYKITITIKLVTLPILI